MIIVDDIDHKSQFKAFISSIQKLGANSQIVTIPRQFAVLKHAIAIAVNSGVYEVPPLNKLDLHCLYNSYAFLSEILSEGFANLATKVVDAYGDQLLLLETIRTSLFEEKNLIIGKYR